MNNIEKLAIDSEEVLTKLLSTPKHDLYLLKSGAIKVDSHGHVAILPSLDDLLAKALQSSEPVAEVVEDKLADWSKPFAKVNWIKTDFDIGTKFYTIPPSTVLLEEHNKRIAELETSVLYWKTDSASAWDKCEERRMENEALQATNKNLLDALEEYALWHTFGVDGEKIPVNNAAKAIADAEGVDG